MGTTNSDNDSFTTTLGGKRSLVLFAVAIVLIIGMFFMVKTYRELRGETIVIDSEEDVVQAQADIQNELRLLDEDKNKLRALITTG